MPTTIEFCKTCSSKPHSQDEIHGKGKRVFNARPGGTKDLKPSPRCTVCGGLK
jgi:hypothetical protein